MGFLAEAGDVAGGGVAEKPSVVAGELRGAEITDLAAGGSGVGHQGEHEAAGFLKTQNFLILQRAHVGDGPEVLVEGGDAHVNQVGEVFDSHRLRVVVTNPSNGLGNTMDAGFSQSHLGDAGAERAAKKADEDFVLDERREKFGFARVSEALEEANESVEDVRIDWGDVDGFSFVNGAKPAGEDLKEQFVDFQRVEIEPQTEERVSVTGFCNLCCDRECDGEDEHARGVVLEDVLADDYGLGALGNDAERWNLESVNAIRVDPRVTADEQARDAHFEAAVVRGVGSDAAGELGQLRGRGLVAVPGAPNGPDVAVRFHA